MGIIFPKAPPAELEFAIQSEIVERCFDHLRRRPRGSAKMGICVYGKSGAGKTVAVRKAAQAWSKSVEPPFRRKVCEISLAGSSSGSFLDDLLAGIHLIDPDAHSLDSLARRYAGSEVQVLVTVHDAERLLEDRAALRTLQDQVLKWSHFCSRERRGYDSLKLILTSQSAMCREFGELLEDVPYEQPITTPYGLTVSRSVTAEDVREVLSADVIAAASEDGYLFALLHDQGALAVAGDSLSLALLKSLLQRTPNASKQAEVLVKIEEHVRDLFCEARPRPPGVSIGEFVGSWARANAADALEGRFSAGTDPRNRIRRRLFRMLLDDSPSPQSPIHRTILTHLLSIAVVDPSMGCLRGTDWQGFLQEVSRSNGGDVNLPPEFGYLFHMPDRAAAVPRLTHHSVLDLYDGPPDKGVSRNFGWPFAADLPPEAAHARVADFLQQKREGVAAGGISDLPIIRHRIRSGIPGLAECAAMLDRVASSARYSAPHALAWGYGDLVAQFGVLRPFVEGVANKNGAGTWFHVPRARELQLNRRLIGISLEALVVFGELSYQALDAWEAVAELSRHIYNAMRLTKGITDSTKSDAAGFIVSLHGIMLYDWEGRPEDCRAVLQEFLDEAEGKDKPKSRYLWNVKANLLLARLKADVAQAGPDHGEWMAALEPLIDLQKEIIAEVWTVDDPSPEAGIDQFRLRSNAGRLFHFAYGFGEAASCYESVISAMKEGDSADANAHHCRSQEYLYCCIGYAFVLLCSGRRKEARTILEDVCSSAAEISGDTWALLQRAYLLTWLDSLDILLPAPSEVPASLSERPESGGMFGKVLTSARAMKEKRRKSRLRVGTESDERLRRVRARFEEAAEKFAMIGDSKAEFCARLASNVVRPADEGEMRSFIGGSEDLLKSEAFYRLVSESYLDDGQRVPEGLLRMWYAESLGKYMPVMPAAVIFRSLPLCYKQANAVTRETAEPPPETPKDLVRRGEWVRAATNCLRRYEESGGRGHNFAVTAIDEHALSALASEWLVESRDDQVASIPWDQVASLPYYRQMPDRFEAALYVDGKLLALAIGEADLSRHYVARDWFQTSPNLRPEASRHSLPLMNEALRAWGDICGAKFMLIMDPPADSITELGDGFHYLDPSVQIPASVAPKLAQGDDALRAKLSAELPAAFYGYCLARIGESESHYKPPFVLSPVDWLNLGERNDPLRTYGNTGKVPIAFTLQALKLARKHGLLLEADSAPLSGV